MDQDTITALTIVVMFYRKLRAMGIYDMPLEIKGLKGKALKARANIDALNAAYDAFNEKAPAHAADVAGLTEQVNGMGEDLAFAVTTLGNSVGESEKPAGEVGQQATFQATATPENKL